MLLAFEPILLDYNLIINTFQKYYVKLILHYTETKGIDLFSWEMSVPALKILHYTGTKCIDLFWWEMSVPALYDKCFYNVNHVRAS